MGATCQARARLAPSMSADARLAAVEAKLTARSEGGRAAAERKLPEPQLPWKFLTPLVWAPVFPMIRHSTKGLQPRSRNALIAVAIGVANVHGFWPINNPDLSDEALGITR